MNEMDFSGNLEVKTPPTSTAGNMGSIPDRGTKVPHVVGCGQKFLKKALSYIQFSSVA